MLKSLLGTPAHTSLTECSNGMTQKLPIGSKFCNFIFHFFIIYIRQQRSVVIQRGMFQLTSVPVLSDVVCIFLCSIVVITLKGILGVVPLLHSVCDITQKCQHNVLTLILLTWRIWWAPNNASRWQMGFNSEFKGLIYYELIIWNYSV